MSRIAQSILVLLRPKALFVADVPLLADCAECHLVIEHQASSWHIGHLIQDHNLTEEEAHLTVEWIVKKVHEFNRILPAETFIHPSVNRCLGGR